MTIKKIVYVILLIFALALQDTWVPKIAVFGVEPYLLIFFVIFSAMFFNPLKACFIGAAIGLVEDLLIGRFIGINLMSMALVGYLISFIGSKFYKDNYLIPIVSVFGGTVLFGFTYIIISHFCGLNLPFFHTLFKVYFPQAIYNAILSTLIYVPVYLFFIEYKKSNDND